MKQPLVLTIVFLILFLIILTLDYLYAEEYPYIPKSKGLEIDLVEKLAKKEVVYKSEVEERLISVKPIPFSSIKSSAKLNFQFKNTSHASIYAPSIFLRTVANHYSVDNANGIGIATGGIVIGITVGYDRYKEAGVIDYNAITKSSALMASSAYVGSLATDAAAAFNPFAASFAGGLVAGGVFAIGAYNTGFADRQTARQMATKSLVGTSITTSASLILGTSAATTGIFSLGTLIIPYATGVASVYAVEKLFEMADKNEEIERIGFLIRTFK